MKSECCTTSSGSAIDAADHPPRGIFHPLGAAFFSNATYPETLKIIDESGVSIEEFALAGAREQFFFNITTGATEPVPAPSPLFLQAVAAEIPRYIQLWNQVFKPIDVISYKVRLARTVFAGCEANTTTEWCSRRPDRFRRGVV